MSIIDRFTPEQSTSSRQIPRWDDRPLTSSAPASTTDDHRPVVLLVDDDRSFLSMVCSTLQPYQESWRLSVHSDPEEAWKQIFASHVDAVISDLSMPRLSGFDLLRRIRGHASTHDIPVTILTGTADGDVKHDALDLGATDLLAKPFHTAELLARLRSMLRLKEMQDAAKRRSEELEELVASREKELNQSRREVIWKLAKAAEFRDEKTGDHVVRVARMSARIARELGLSSQKVDAIEMAAPLHDIGKIGIPDSILLKPGSLTSDERDVMRRHCDMGFRILSESGQGENRPQFFLPFSRALAGDDVMKTAQEIALSHHEWWDGTGYPRGLSGTEIPLTARIVAVADVYDALRSVRPYKEALSPDEALQEIRWRRGRQFDPQVVDAFLRCHEPLAREHAASWACDVALSGIEASMHERESLAVGHCP